MNLLTAELGLLVALGPGYSLTGHLSLLAQDEPAAVQDSPACDGLSFHDSISEVPAGEFDPLSVPLEDGIVWYGTWEDAMAERDRTGKPVMLHFGSPRRPREQVCVPGTW